MLMRAKALNHGMMSVFLCLLSGLVPSSALSGGTHQSLSTDYEVQRNGIWKREDKKKGSVGVLGSWEGTCTAREREDEESVRTGGGGGGRSVCEIYKCAMEELQEPWKRGKRKSGKPREPTHLHHCVCLHEQARTWKVVCKASCSSSMAAGWRRSRGRRLPCSTNARSDSSCGREQHNIAPRRP